MKLNANIYTIQLFYIYKTKRNIFGVFSLEGDNKELNLVPIRSSRCAAERRYLKSTEPPKSPLPFAQVTHLHLIHARQLLLSCIET